HQHQIGAGIQTLQCAPQVAKVHFAHDLIPPLPYGFATLRHPYWCPPHTAWRWWLSWGMGALAPVIELPSKLQERQLLFGIRGVSRPGRTPVGVFQDRGDGFSPAVQGASDSHRWNAGAK